MSIVLVPTLIVVLYAIIGVYIAVVLECVCANPTSYINLQAVPVPQ